MGWYISPSSETLTGPTGVHASDTQSQYRQVRQNLIHTYETDIQSTQMKPTPSTQRQTNIPYTWISIYPIQTDARYKYTAETNTQ